MLPNSLRFWEPSEPGSINSLVLGDGKPPTFNDGNPYNGYINPYYWVDDHPLLYGNNGSLDPGTSGEVSSGLFSLENHGFSGEKCMYLKGKYVYIYTIGDTPPP